MMSHSAAGDGAKWRERSARQREYQLLVLLVFPFFLVFAVVARLLPWRPSAPQAVDAPRRSVMSEALEASRTVVAFAFMG